VHIEDINIHWEVEILWKDKILLEPEKSTPESIGD